MAVRAWNIHFTKSMMAFRFMIFLAAKRDWKWILHIVWTCWMTNNLLLLTKINKKSKITDKAGCILHN